MITKVSTVDEIFLGDAPVRTLKVASTGLDFLDKKRLKKQGSSLLSKIAKLEPKKGKVPLFIVPMGAYEYYSSNRNGDAWFEKQCTKYTYNGDRIDIKEGLIERHPTFVTHAKMYTEHDNKDPKKASGEIVLSDYNTKMGRVEVVSYVDEDTWEEELNDIDNGKNTGVSMAANVDLDYCSVCSNKAASANDYCYHIKFMTNAILDDGHVVCMWNETPTFIDISRVKEPADRLGVGLARLTIKT